VDAGWSTYAGLGRGSDVFGVPGIPGTMLGLPSHKGVLRASVRPLPALTLGGVATGLSPRWSLSDGETIRHAAALLFDAVVSVEHARSGFTVAVSGHDLLDAAPRYIQPRPGELAPLPAHGRTLGLRVSWSDGGRPR
jgi:hypothetical protein